MQTPEQHTFPKTPSGIHGLDEILGGGFPKGRPILVCGGAGCGKTLLATQFLVKGITDHDEPGVFMSFEESGKDLVENVWSLGFDLEKLVSDKKMRIDYVRVERSEIEETGEYDLEGLFIRLNYAIDSIGAKRVVLDTIESLFSGINNASILRSELRRLFRWLKEKGVTAIITGERGESSFTRQGLEEYVSDCVILLDLRVIDQIATRRLRIVKYRGSMHGTNEYPFLIDENGISVIPVTSLKLDYTSSEDIVSTGIPELDKLFSRGGLFRGSSTLITGSAGTAKSILASYMALSGCRRNETVLFFSFEESPDQIVRNMKTIGLDLEPCIDSGKLHLHASRPTLQGLEMHLMTLYKLMDKYEPKTVIIDPISSLMVIGSNSEVRSMLVRLMDVMKTRQINSVFVSLTHRVDNPHHDPIAEAISSLADTWINLFNSEKESDRARSLLIVKSRGMGHLNVRKSFQITERGIQFQND